MNIVININIEWYEKIYFGNIFSHIAQLYKWRISVPYFIILCYNIYHWPGAPSIVAPLILSSDQVTFLLNFLSEKPVLKK